MDNAAARGGDSRVGARGGGGQRGERGERLFPHVALDGVQRLGVRGPVGARARLVQVVALPVRVHRDEHDAVPLAQAQVRVDEDEHLAQRDVEIAGDAPVLGVGLEHQHDRRPGGFRWVGRRGGTEVRRALERRSRDLALVSTRGRPRRERREKISPRTHPLRSWRSWCQRVTFGPRSPSTSHHRARPRGLLAIYTRVMRLGARGRASRVRPAHASSCPLARVPLVKYLFRRVDFKLRGATMFPEHAPVASHIVRARLEMARARVAVPR